MPPGYARDARPRRPSSRSLLSSALIAGACTLPFLMHTADRALADVGGHGKDSTDTATVVAADARHRDPAFDVHETSRTARVVGEQIRERRVQARHERTQRQSHRANRRELSRWVLPVNGAEWSAPFGQAGTAWSSGYHTGQDFTAPYGTPVMAAGAGTITFAGWSDAYGNKIEITHADGDQTWYAHLSDFAGASGTVSPGDVIGYVGCTGNCYGTHLHFEFHPGGGAAADPIAWLRSQGAR